MHHHAPTAPLATLVAALLATLLVACDRPTAPPPPLVLTETPNHFALTFSGAHAGDQSGSALHAPGALGAGRQITLTSDPGPEVSIVFEPGLLTAGTFDFPVGSQSFSGLPGLHPLDATITFIPTDEYYFATAGTIEIVESSPTAIRGRFDLTATPSGGGAKIRARGTFWSVPAP